MSAIKLVDSNNRDAWLAARNDGLSATDVSRLMTPSGRRLVIVEKLHGVTTIPNVYMDYGHDREPAIAEMVFEKYAIPHNTWLYASAENPKHLATPDGVGVKMLAEIKTSTKPLPNTTPRNYRDQILWQLHVMDFRRAVLAWEEHFNGIPVDLEPTYRIIERDDTRIAELVKEANELLAYIEKERANAN